MIEDLVDNVLKYKSKIERYIDDRLRTYAESDCRKILQSRMQRIGDAVDMRYHSTDKKRRQVSDWKSKMIMPLTREQFVARRASLAANYVQDPLFFLSAQGATPIENATNAGDVLNSNLRYTRFREICFDQIQNSVARYGAAVCLSQYRQSKEMVRKTTRKMIGGVDLGYGQMDVPRYKGGVYNYLVEPLNYFQNPAIPVPEYADYQGYYCRESLSDFMSFVKGNEELYLMDEVKKQIAAAKKDAASKRSSGASFKPGNADEWNWVGIDIAYWYGRVHIDGNEDDGTKFYAELSDDGKLLRFQPVEYDEEITPLTVFTVDKRPEYWWGNVDTEAVIPMENQVTLFLNMTADAGMRGLQQLIFYDKTLGLDPAAIQEQAKQGGMIPLALKPNQKMNDLFKEYHFEGPTLNNVDYILRESKEAAARLKTRPDLQRTAQEGGLQNKTATAANIATAGGDIMEGYYLRQFDNGMKGLARVDMILLQQFLEDRFSVRPNPREPQRQLEKWQILGDYDYTPKSSLTINKQQQLMNIFNTITAIMNFQGGGHPSWQNVQIDEIIHQWLKKSLEDTGVDIDKVHPENMPPPMPQGMPGMPPGPAGMGGPAGPPPEMPPQMAGPPPGALPMKVGAGVAA